MRRVFVVLVAVMAVLAFAGCKRGGGQASTKVTVTMVDFGFQPNPIRLKAGVPVEVTLVNKGANEHEVLIGRNVKKEDGKPAGFEVDLFDHGKIPVEIVSGKDYKKPDAKAIQEEGWHVEIEPGGQVTLRFTIPPEKAGEWEIACFLPGHYEAGMHGKVIVVP